MNPIIRNSINQEKMMFFSMHVHMVKSHLMGLLRSIIESKDKNV
jgi:hypothetical protein